VAFEPLPDTIEPSGARGHNGSMHDGDLERIAVWLVERGLAGTSEAAKGELANVD
jgi:hypothetical protein